MRILNLPLLFFFCYLFSSCSSSKNISGTYRSNFAVLGFFVTEITLRMDSTFDYHFKGDALNKKAKGYYKVDGRKLYLNYKFDPIDTSQYAYFRSIEFPIEDDKKWHSSFPRLFFIKNNRIYETNSKGKIIRRKKPILIFNKHKIKYYLKKVEE